MNLFYELKDSAGQFLSSTWNGQWNEFITK